MKDLHNYKLNKKWFLLPLLLIFAISMYGQERNISGIVKDELGNPLHGAVVTITGTNLSAITNEAGEFTISIIEKKGNISFELAGFQAQELDLSNLNDQVIIVLIKAETSELDKKVDIAYGKMYMKDLTSAVSAIHSDEISKSIHPNLTEALIGRLNGVVTFPSSFEPGNTSYSIYLRGLKTSSENNSPLILVDDVERDFSQLSVNEIESITVLKDASALALYGSRAANGVILVKTKRGMMTGREVNIIGQMGVQEVVGLRQYLNSYDYATLYNKAYQLDGNTGTFYSQEALDGYKKTVDNSPDADPYRYPNNNYMDQFINRLSFHKKADITMSGGNSTARYFALAGYTKQDGVFKYGDVNDEYSTNTNYQRFNFRSNVDVTLSKITTAFLDMSGRIELRHYPGTSAYNIFNTLTTTPANAYPIFNPNGSLGGTATYSTNPYGLITQSGYTETLRRIFETQVGFRLDLNDWIKGLSFTAKTGFDFNNLKNRGLTRNFKVYEYRYDVDTTINEYGTNSSSNYEGANTSNGFYRHVSAHTQIDYQRSFSNKHNLVWMGFFNMSSRSEPGNNPKFKTVAFGTRAQYNYKRKYYLEALLSTTANEAFMLGNRFGYFPAASVGWVISEENFLKGLKVINYLKIRGSYGKSGLDRPYGTNADYRFLYLDEWTTGSGGYAFGNPQTTFSGSYEAATGNKNLRWEVAKKTDIGIDAEFLNNQLYLSGDYYTEERTDIWVKRYGSVMATYGGSLPYENAGIVKSNGLELAIGARGTKQHLKYDVKAMASYNHSKIVDLQEAAKTWDYQYIKGKQLGEIWALQSMGLFGDSTEITNSVRQSFGIVRPGDIKYLDYNNDSVVDNNDYRATGKTSFPQWTFSLSASFAYKNFDFSMLWQGMADRYIYTPLFELPFWNGNASENAFDCWTRETAETAKYPRLTVSNYANNSQGSDFWLVNASYLRLKSIEFGYTLPKALVKKIWFDNIRFYLNGYNLLTISGQDFDPEEPYAGIYQYPASRVYTVGINFTF